MFKKIKSFFNWLRGKNPADALPADAVAWQICTSKDSLGTGHELYVFEGTRFQQTCLEIPDEREENETFWSIPKSSFSLDLTFPADVPEKMYRIQTSLRFEPKDGLGSFLYSFQTQGIKCLTKTSLGILIRELLDNFLASTRKTLEDLLKMSEREREELCSRFSVLLFAKGLRCEVLKVPELVDAAEFQDADGQTAAQEMEEVLQPVLDQIKTGKEWEAFVEQLQEQGLPVDETLRQELQELGDALLKKDGLTSLNCVKLLRQMAEEAFERKCALDLDYWSSENIEKRLERKLARKEEDAPEVVFCPLNVEVEKSKRPRKGWFNYYETVDRDLQKYLKTKLEQISQKLAVEAAALSEDVWAAAELRKLADKVNLAQEQLKTVPCLEGAGKALRIAKKEMPKLVKILDQAVTAAEYIEAVLNSSESRKNPAFKAEIETAAQSLSDLILKRRAVR